jgi:hypothetical protein
MTPDEVHDHAYDLRTAENRLAEDPDVRAEDRKLQALLSPWVMESENHS